jgi:hypothetical protein
MKRIRYTWGEGNLLAGKFCGNLKDWAEGTEEEFIGNNFWAFKKVNALKTLEFQVIHRPWKMRILDEMEVSFDFEALYGADFAAAIEKYGGKPSGVFYVDGSEVEVTAPSRIEKN